MEAQLLHNPFKARSFNPIKRLAHIKLDCHETLFPFTSLIDAMHCLKGDKDIVGD